MSAPAPPLGGLEHEIERLAAAEAPEPDRGRAAVLALLDALEAGAVRAAVPEDGGWRALPWVKRGILLGFRLGEVVPMAPAGPMAFRDKDLFPTRV